MKNEFTSSTLNVEEDRSQTTDDPNSSNQPGLQRRSFVKGLGIAAAAISAGTLLPAFATDSSKGASLSKGDAAILRFLAAAEILESDLWVQYNELGGIQDDEVPFGTGNPAYTEALKVLDEDMDQYIHDNTEDELSHETFINAYLISKGYDPVSLDGFRNLPSSTATGANNVGRLTNLMELTVDTSWWTRYRARNGNPDLGDHFQQAVPSLAVNKHPAIPRNNDDVNDTNFLTAIAFTAGFHFAFIEQGGSSLYPMLAQRVTNVEVLRILLSIGGTEIAHFQTWQDKAGNATPLDVVDPMTGVKVSFADLTDPAVGENLQANLIMPEPTSFLNRDFPRCSVIRPTNTKNAAMGAVKGLTDDGLFIGQSAEFASFIKELATQADAARRG